MERAVIITGSNEGDRDKLLRQARRLIEEQAGEIVALSPIMESEPWGEFSDRAGRFSNQVLVVQTKLSATELLDALQSVETELGRNRRVEQGELDGQRRVYRSRTIDIDILYYGREIIETARLKIPHPLIAEREFVLRPLAQVLPEHKDPLTGLTAGEMLELLRKRAEN